MLECDPQAPYLITPPGLARTVRLDPARPAVTSSHPSPTTSPPSAGRRPPPPPRRAPESRPSRAARPSSSWPQPGSLRCRWGEKGEPHVIRLQQWHRLIVPTFGIHAYPDFHTAVFLRTNVHASTCTQINQQSTIFAKAAGMRSVAVYGGAPKGPQIRDLHSGAQVCEQTYECVNLPPTICTPHGALLPPACANP